MSTNYTENYKLCQWEAGDKVQRVDFNADNLKIDAALTAQKNAVERAQSTANAAYSPGYKPVVTGGYHGSGATSRFIDLGFHPRAVLVLEAHLFMNDNNYNYSAVAVDGLSFVTENPLKISGNGFYVYHDTSSGARKGTNLSGFSYLYLAIR